MIHAASKAYIKKFIENLPDTYMSALLTIHAQMFLSSILFLKINFSFYI